MSSKDGGPKHATARPWRRYARMLAWAGAVCMAFMMLVAAGSIFYVASLSPVQRQLETSTVVLDRNERLLRAYAMADGRWRLPVRPEQVDPRFVAALIAYEDKRFYSHSGMDPIALARAGVQLIAHGRIVSGASTLTMQVARLLEPRTERSLARKLHQMARAIQIERTFSKTDILALYLTLAPYGGNLEGIRAATLAYFGKEPRRLSLAETALLVALPQSPEARRPDRNLERARRMRDRVLARLSDSGSVATDEVAQARSEPVPNARKAMPAYAPHTADRIAAGAPARKKHRLTIDRTIQSAMEELARDRAHALGPDLSAAVLVIDHEIGHVIARVGSADYFSERRAGQVDMTEAVRSPGSTLKPFIYGLGFEDGVIHPETLIDDRPTRYGSYAPENFDLTFQGTVSVRKALQLSLNVPAVAVLESVRASRLTARLRSAGGDLVLPMGEVPGLAMGLGGVGVKLADLVMLFGGIARGGEAVHLVENSADAAPAPVSRLLEPVAAWYVGQTLLGTPPPENALGGRIAFKTGTSYGYRDAWAIGFDGKHTIGVWVGRPDGAPVPGLTGRSAAAPLLFDAFARLGTPPAPLAKAPRGVLHAVNQRLPAPLQRFRPGALAGDTWQRPVKIVFPPNGAQLERQASSGGAEPLALKVAGGVGPLTMLVNGVPVSGHSQRRVLFWSPDGPGFVRLTVIDGRGAADSVVVRVQYAPAFP